MKNGDVYVAIKGERLNGNDYIENAINNGAKVCIITKTDLKFKVNRCKYY